LYQSVNKICEFLNTLSYKKVCDDENIFDIALPSNFHNDKKGSHKKKFFHICFFLKGIIVPLVIDTYGTSNVPSEYSVREPASPK